jgi:CO/xanthine dehydrogenase Mo-binding subunit
VDEALKKEALLDLAAWGESIQEGDVKRRLTKAQALAKQAITDAVEEARRRKEERKKSERAAAWAATVATSADQADAEAEALMAAWEEREASVSVEGASKPGDMVAHALEAVTPEAKPRERAMLSEHTSHRAHGGLSSTLRSAMLATSRNRHDVAITLW